MEDRKEASLLVSCLRDHVFREGVELMDKITEIIPLEGLINDEWLMKAMENGQMWNAVMGKLKRYQSALTKIVDCHGTHEILRHECLKMANLARAALEEDEK